MAFNPAPSAWIPNWSANATTITVPIASYPELTAAEANATTGDIRKLYYAQCAQMHEHYLAELAADRPTRMTFNKNISTDTTTGVSTVYFTFQFQCSISAMDVANEP